jgi:leucine dehydrogenase
MSVFEHPDFDHHEHVAFHQDPESGLSAIIAVHNTNLGPGLGGCRMFNYADSGAALTDVLRLSKGMTYKAAMASLPLGGGKSVIIGDARTQKTKQMMEQMGRFVESLNGQYIIAEDSGISVPNVLDMAKHTEHVGGVSGNLQFDGSPADGNPAPATAYGVFVGLREAVSFRLGKDLRDVSVAITGVGSVGMRLAEHLHKAGAKLFVADVFEPNCKLAEERFNATIVDVADISSIEVDVFAPCALGNAINQSNVDSIKAKVISGAANNQLQFSNIGDELHAREILYAPDYVINAGGIIDIHHQKINSEPNAIKNHLEGIADSLKMVFERSVQLNEPTSLVADRLAEERFN